MKENNINNLQEFSKIKTVESQEKAVIENNPEEIDATIINKSRDSIVDFENNTRDMLNMLENRAQADHLTIDQRDKEELKALDKSAISAFTDLLTKLGIKIREFSHKIFSQDSIDDNTQKLSYEREINKIDTENLIKPECKQNYQELSGFSFPVFQNYKQVGNSSKVRYIDKLGTRLYTHPTEPYNTKMNFLKRNGIDNAKNILAILGANWPVLYADLSGGASNVIAVDENLKQIEFLDIFLNDENKFLDTLEQNSQFLKKEVPYYPNIKTVIKAGGLKKRVFDKKTEKYNYFKRLSSTTKQMCDDGKLIALHCDIKDIPQDINIENIDYIDLSNVQELVGWQETSEIINSFSPGTKVYMSFISTPPKEATEDFILKLSNVKILDIKDFVPDTPTQRLGPQRLVLLEVLDKQDTGK